VRRLLDIITTIGMYTIIGVFLVIVVCTAGCKPESQTPTAQAPTMPKAVMPDNLRPGDTVAFRYHSDGGGSESNEQVKGVGAGAEATGAELNQSLAGSAPNASLSAGGGASGGSFDSRIKAITPESLLTNPFAWSAIVAFLAAGVLAYKGRIRQAAYVAGCGVVLLAAALYPMALIGVAAIAAFAYYRETRYREPLRAVIQGVEDSPEHIQVAVKSAIAKAQDKGDREVIRQVKTEDGY
jgi:hypothetical protein